MSRVTIIDYGIGNLLSVKRAFEHSGAEVLFAHSPKQIAQAERLILPGVGAFADGMSGLRERGLIESIRHYAKQGRPFLGICLGMQMMLDVGEEFGENEGLGIIHGRVIRMPNTGYDNKLHKVPNIGWYGLHTDSNNKERWMGTIFHGIQPGNEVYVVHSYMAVPDNNENYLAYYDYDGRKICAAIYKENVYGCQFHPEKSGQVGLQIIKSFLNI